MTDIRIADTASNENTCGCGYVDCCGQCVPHEEADRLQRDNEDVVMVHCSPECSCGGIPTLISARFGEEKPAAAGEKE